MSLVLLMPPVLCRLFVLLLLLFLCCPGTIRQGAAGCHKGAYFNPRKTKLPSPATHLSVSGRNTATSPTTIPAHITRNQNTARNPSVPAMIPPITGPIATDTCRTPAKVPVKPPRSDAGAMSAMTPAPIEMVEEQPAAWKKRRVVRTGMEGERARPILERRNSL
ncbi:hypothetical protein MPH_06460 [Macrophomina phaseolina MS6]|uniref:Secreted protein n=1 Tax=Macrophomina phaseolina (strain MS6) TaxID=1126212 RepID=K2RNL6_MACPH|nr:hypothetical protein MPH_06460 [Macrophomina phaseolina MS6]